MVTVEVKLSQGMVALIDREDLDLVQQHRWYVRVQRSPYTAYAATNVRRLDGRRTTLLMHRLILGLTDPAVHVDHRDGNGLNNQRFNLRACSNAENQRNQRKSVANTSGFKGVKFYKTHGKWAAGIQHNGKHHHLGYFHDPAEAHAAYCRAADELHGEFANYGD